MACASRKRNLASVLQKLNMLDASKAPQNTHSGKNPKHRSKQVYPLSCHRIGISNDNKRQSALGD